MFKGFGLPEILLILFIVLLLFGATRLPQMGNALGRSIREFKKGFSGEGEPPRNAQPTSTNSKSESGQTVQH